MRDDDSRFCNYKMNLYTHEHRCSQLLTEFFNSNFVLINSYLKQNVNNTLFKHFTIFRVERKQLFCKTNTNSQKVLKLIK